MPNASGEVDPGDDSGNRIPTSDYVYVILTAVTSGLSIFGGTCICVLYFVFKDLRSPGRKLLLFLAFSDSMLALGNLLGIVWHLYSDSAIINKSEGYCDFQSAMTIYFSMTSFAWTVTMATSLFVTVVLNKQSFTVTYMKLFHILAWIPAGIITITALSMNVLGTDTTLEQASWCWIDTRVPNVLLWQFVTGKFFEITAYITTVVLYAAIKFFLIRQAKKKIGRITRRQSRRDTIAEANRKLTFVPLVFIVCRIWGTVRFLIGNFGQDIENEPYVTWINPLQGIGDSIQGFANFVLYCISTRSIRRRMFPCSNKIQDVSLYNTDNRTENSATVVKKNAVGPSSLKPEPTANLDISDSIFCTDKMSHKESATTAMCKISTDDNVNSGGNKDLVAEKSKVTFTEIDKIHKPDTETDAILKPADDVTFVKPINITSCKFEDNTALFRASPACVDRKETEAEQESQSDEARKDIQLRYRTPVVQFRFKLHPVPGFFSAPSVISDPISASASVVFGGRSHGAFAGPGFMHPRHTSSADRHTHEPIQSDLRRRHFFTCLADLEKDVKQCLRRVASHPDCSGFFIRPQRCELHLSCELDESSIVCPQCKTNMTEHPWAVERICHNRLISLKRQQCWEN